MYAGHVGFALGAKGFRSSLPLWALVIASQLPDWTDATGCLAGLHSATPGMFSHSFPAIGLLTVLATFAYLAFTRDVTGAYFVGALVISHVLGDYFTGLKPTWSGGPMVGLELYHLPLWDFAVEGIVVLGGWLVYRRSLPMERRSLKDTWSLLGVLLAVQALADIVFFVSPGLRKC